MKKRSLILIIILLLIAAGALGWFLPTVVFQGMDRSLEGKPEPVSIRQVDLSYQSDLQITDRLRLMQSYTFASSTSLERGVYQDAEQVRRIVENFLRQLTGFHHTVTAQNCTAQPTLLSFNGEGVFVAWTVAVSLNDAWSFDAVLDDQTGLILCCELESIAQHWDRLFPSFYEAESSEVFLYNSLQEAIRQHYQAQLSVSYTATVIADDSDGNICYGNVLLYEGDQESYRVPFWFVVSEGMLRIGW